MCSSVRPCPKCGIGVTPKIAVKNRRICKYCLRAQNRDNFNLKREAKLSERRRKWKEQYGKPEREAKCIVCLEKFTTTVDWQVVCKKESCIKIAKKVRNRRYYKPNKEPEVKFCTECGKEIVTKWTRKVLCSDNPECVKSRKRKLQQKYRLRLKQEKDNAKNSNNDKRENKPRKGLSS